MIKIYTDGGSRGNPGPAATGVVIIFPDGTIKKTGSFLGNTTNNVAEYSAVKEAYEYLLNNYSVINEELYFYLDSLLVASQLSGLYKIKDSTLFKLASAIKSLEKNFQKQPRYAHIPREKNKDADALVNQVLDANINK